MTDMVTCYTSLKSILFSPYGVIYSQMYFAEKNDLFNIYFLNTNHEQQSYEIETSCLKITFFMLFSREAFLKIFI